MRCFFVVWVSASTADVPPVEQAGKPKFTVKVMLTVPATAKVPTIELDGISELKVKVLSLTPEPMVRFVTPTEDRMLGPPAMLTAPAKARRVTQMRFWSPSPSPTSLTTKINMLEVVKPDDAEEGRVRPLPPPMDMAGRGMPRGGRHCPKVRHLCLSWLRCWSFEKVRSCRRHQSLMRGASWPKIPSSKRKVTWLECLSSTEGGQAG